MSDEHEHQNAQGEYVCHYCKKKFPKDEQLVVTIDGPCHISCLAKAEREENDNE